MTDHDRASDRGEAILARARSLTGARFRLYGRDPATGLDCVGVVGCALNAVSDDVRLPTAYGLRQRSFAPFLPYAEALGLSPCLGALLAGDILLFKVGPVQRHLAVSDGCGGLIHAHAGLSRVVHGKADPDWRLICHWRFTNGFSDNS